MNIIKINGIAYILPTDAQKLHSVLNHIDMVKKNLKEFVKLQDLNLVWHKLSAFEIKNAKISTTIMD